MANTYCEGDFFTVNGLRYYRCFWDSTIMEITDTGEECTNCKREIHGQELGEVETRKIIQARIRPNEWQSLPPNV